MRVESDTDGPTLRCRSGGYSTYNDNIMYAKCNGLYDNGTAPCLASNNNIII